MGQNNYLEYIIQLTLTLIAVSSAYLFDPSNLLTATVFIFIPILFGYTAYSSSESFQYASLLSIIALIFLAIEKLAPAAIVIGIGNPLISLVSNERSFKDYYKAVSIPMLITGIILGTTVFLAASNDPDIRNTIQNTTADIVSSQTSDLIEETNIVEQQKQASKKMIKDSSKASIALTQQYVANNTKELSFEDRKNISEAFLEAQEEVPERLVQNAENQTEDMNIEKRASQSVKGLINEDNLIVLIPAITIGFYGLHPILGLLTAIFGSSFSYLGRKISGS